MNIVFLNSHPIQYFAPLYQAIATTQKNILLQVIYCSDESIKGKKDEGFGTNVQWDVPLLDGYNSVFIKNYAFKPSIHTGFWGLMNFGIINYLYKKPKSNIIVHGWSSLSHVITIIFGKLFNHTICLRAETPLNQELKKNQAIRKIKNLWLRFLFMFIDKYLYIGTQNKLFYESLGVKQNNLIFAPYCVDNDRFKQVANSITKVEARQKLNLPINEKIILFSGKYINKKRPLDLLQAFANLNSKDAFLVLVGEGELRNEMENFIAAHNLQNNVLLTGFINQSVIPYYYASADIFVMCSGLGETWGLSVNEAMNFSLPVIVSNTCGSSYNLVQQGINGFTFNEGDIQTLQNCIHSILELSNSEYSNMQQASLSIINNYSFKQVMQGLLQLH